MSPFVCRCFCLLFISFSDESISWIDPAALLPTRARVFPFPSQSISVEWAEGCFLVSPVGLFLFILVFISSGRHGDERMCTSATMYIYTKWSSLVPAWWWWWWRLWKRRLCDDQRKPSSSVLPSVWYDPIALVKKEKKCERKSKWAKMKCEWMHNNQPSSSNKWREYAFDTCAPHSFVLFPTILIGFRTFHNAPFMTFTFSLIICNGKRLSCRSF